MKKALVLALTVLMVLSLATAAFAVEVTYSGKVSVKMAGESVDGENNDKAAFEKDALEAKVELDFTKDYGDGVTAGVKVKTEVQNEKVWDDEDENDAYDPGEKPTREIVFDTDGWIQVDKDFFTVKASTGIDDQVGKNLKENPIANAAGVALTVKNVVDGLTLNTVFNNGNPSMNYVIKGEYASDLFTVGGGFQKSEIKEQAFGVYGTLNLIDGLTIDAEYNNRDEDNKVDDNEKNAIFATASYTLDALTAKAGLLVQDGYFKSISADDVDNEDWRINEAWRSDTKRSDRFNTTDKATIIFADASYKLTDAFEVNGYVDYLVNAKDKDDKEVKKDKNGDDLDKVSYKLGAAYTLGDLKLEAWYKAYVGNEIAGKATYTLADGVESSFQVGFGKDDKDNKDEKGKISYTAQITANL